ncbi:DUF916 domain-containing protein [Streptomyces sp. NPDC001941]|uniref:WxL protein peptidoglycan domain-containing protein n=1 Tax=Streptomyces sp. NPDC001941 TaxID=3154659 RepID=UPI00331717B5
MPRTLRTALRALLPALLLGPLLTLLGAPAAHAADNGEFAVYPAASQLGQRPYFYLAADPGGTLTDKVVLTNRTTGPLTFRLYGADAYNTARDGGFAVRSATERQRDVGAWTRPGLSRVTVPAGRSVTVPYTLTVPATAEPGDHVGALVALDERVARTSGQVAVGVQKAVGARLYLRVSGPTVPALSVEDVTLRHSAPLVPGTGDSTAVLSYTLYNRGNVTLDPKVALRAEGLFGRTLLARDLAGVPAELLPRQRIRLTARWDGAPQLDRVSVSLTATAKDVSESARVSFLALPWLAAGVLLAALLAALGALLLRARRTRVLRAA